MGVATLDGTPFRIDPYSVSWTYTVKTSDRKTIGGKVVQVYGTNLGDMSVQGSFGVGGWEEQAEFLARMKEVGDRSVAWPAKPPLRFLYPTQGWDFLVWLKQFSQPGAQASVDLDVETFAPAWSLTFQIAADNSGLKHVAQDAFISRISAGLGWSEKHHGPMTYQEIESTLSGMTVQDYLNQQFSVGATTRGGDVSEES